MQPNDLARRCIVLSPEDRRVCVLHDQLDKALLIDRKDGTMTRMNFIWDKLGQIQDDSTAQLPSTHVSEHLREIL